MSPGPSIGTPSRIDIESIQARAMVCTDCRLAETRTQVVWSAGNLDSDVLFIGEAPGFHEDKQGVAFVGAAGKLLDTVLAEVGLDRTQVAIVNVIKCRPPNNRDPLPDEIEACRPYLEAQLAHMRPRVIDARKLRNPLRHRSPDRHHESTRARVRVPRSDRGTDVPSRGGAAWRSLRRSGPRRCDPRRSRGSAPPSRREPSPVRHGSRPGAFGTTRALLSGSQKDIGIWLPAY